MRLRGKIFIVITIVLVILIGYGSWVFYRLDQVFKNDAELIRKLSDPTTPEYKANMEQWKRVREGAALERKGDNYYKEGNYDLAIEWYKKALVYVTEHGGTIWSVHMALFYAYEKACYYEKALEEIDWIIAQKSTDDLLAKRERVKKLLQESKLKKENNKH